MSPRPYVGSYSGKKGHEYLLERWIIALAINYWHNLGSMMDKAKEMIPKQCRIGDKYFTPLATIGGNLFTRHLKNINHVHKDSNRILSVIIILGKNVYSGETVFIMERK